MSIVLDALEADHRKFTALLDELAHEVELFALAAEPDYARIVEITDYLGSAPDKRHHPSEDLIYERLVERDPETALMHGDMTAEHQRLKRMVHRFSDYVSTVLLDGEIPRRDLVSAARELIEFYRSHMLLEEMGLFHAARRALTSADWDTIDAAGQELDPGPVAPA